jgi:hypothetical protein
VGREEGQQEVQDGYRRREDNVIESIEQPRRSKSNQNGETRSDRGFDVSRRD